MGEERGDQRAGERAVGLPVEEDPRRCIFPDQPVAVLPVGQGLGEGNVLSVGEVVGDAPAVDGGEPGGQRHLHQQAGIHAPVAQLDRALHPFHHLAAARNPMGSDREPLLGGMAQPPGVLNEPLGGR